MLGDGPEQPVFVAEMVVDGATSYLGSVCDVLQCNGGVAAFGEEIECAVADPFGGPGGIGGAGSWHVFLTYKVYVCWLYTSTVYVKERPVALTSIYPVLMSADVAAAADFYRQVFGFDTTFESDWYISLRCGQSELAVIAHDHESIPAEARALPRGVLLNIELEDVDTIHAQVIEMGLEPVLPLRDEPWGQRHFIIEGPDGVVVDVICPIEPSADFVASYS